MSPTAARGWRQLARFGAVGIASNALLYGVFLLLLQAGVAPIPAMTCTYVGTLVLSFALNRRWTFSHGGRLTGPVYRYLLAQGGCYGLNALLLELGARRLGWPAALVQLAAIVVMAALLFLAQKYWVFADETGRAA